MAQVKSRLVAVVLLHATRTLHPPAGGTALIAVLGSEAMHALSYQLLIPTVGGASVLVAVGLCNNLVRGRQYPTYWW